VFDINIFSKELEDVNENDLKKMESDPINFESLQIEYKLKYDGDANELRRDVVQFANSSEEGYIFYGISDNPITISGIEKKEVDALKLVFNNVLPRKIDPILSPFPQFHPVPLSNGKYVFIIKIFPKKYGIYGIRLHDDMNNRNYKRYEFYKRMDGSKHQMSIEDLIELIEKRSSGGIKILETSIHPSVLIGGYDNIFINITAVNKSIRPIIINSYGIELTNEKQIVVFSPFNPKYIAISSQVPIKLQDGEACKANFSRKDFEEILEENGWDYPIKVRAIFWTNDGNYYSDEIELKKIE